LRKSTGCVGLAEREAVFTARGIFAEIGKPRVDCLRGKRARNDINELMGFAVEKSNPLAIEMDRNSVPVGPWCRRGDHWLHRCFGEFGKSAEKFANLAGFDFELQVVGGMLESASAALAIDRAFRRHTARRGFENPHHLGLGVVFLLLHDLCQNALSGQGSMDKANPPVGKATHPRASVADAFDLDGKFLSVGWVHGE
jgi:hypothetical protein